MRERGTLCLMENSAEQNKGTVSQAFKAALPIMLGYVFLGLPCGILSQQIGLSPLQVFLLCALFYSGAGQYMIPNMWLAQSPIFAIIASVTLVNTRQLLYATSLSRYTENSSKRAAFLFGATVTDESFGVNLAKLELGNWSVKAATLVNIFSQSSWTVSCVIGAILGSVLNVPTALASYAMTAIFICLLFSQSPTLGNVAAAIAAALGVFLCKCIGLSGPAIFIGAILGIAVAMIVTRRRGTQEVRAGGAANG